MKFFSLIEYLLIFLNFMSFDVLIQNIGKNKHNYFWLDYMTPYSNKF
jgi:hypothetical protein